MLDGGENIGKDDGEYNGSAVLFKPLIIALKWLGDAVPVALI